MQSFSRGWSFLKQAWSMAFKDKDLLKSSVFAFFVFFALVMIASVINSYTSTAYQTCLYLWAREVEKAQAAGSSMPVRAPAPLAAVLG